MLRKPNRAIEKSALDWNLQTVRRWGCPRKTWSRIKRLANTRKGQKCFTAAPCRSDNGDQWLFLIVKIWSTVYLSLQNSPWYSPSTSTALGSSFMCKVFTHAHEIIFGFWTVCCQMDDVVTAERATLSLCSKPWSCACSAALRDSDKNVCTL
jgi:hypothetical protein